ncbi:hypothetical protein NDU88_003907 [Pleurodeles waltl]|uniref:Uncharacterized protein n=1 Tax=Pleurodeles waltl TaxID=8319 RepID=A0AAV7NSA5_PLEWA|nr:hypothetical protein NDU88_003907 [Pleurodeles waltl]
MTAASAPPDPEHAEHRGLVEKPTTKAPGRESAYGQGETPIPLQYSPEMRGRTLAKEEYYLGLAPTKVSLTGP